MSNNIVGFLVEIVAKMEIELELVLVQESSENAEDTLMAFLLELQVVYDMLRDDGSFGVVNGEGKLVD